MSDLFIYLPDLLNGFWITGYLMVSALGIGFCLAISMTLIHYSSRSLLKKLLEGCIFIICGTPLLVQIFLIYYGLGQWSWLRESYLWLFLREPTYCAVLALSINTACYTSLLLRGAIDSVPENEKAACIALGLSKWQALTRIILPRALLTMLPAYSNEILMIMKSTSLASTITVLDIMGITQHIISQTYQPVRWYVVAACFYLVISGLIAILSQLIQRYFLNKSLILKAN